MDEQLTIDKMSAKLVDFLEQRSYERLLEIYNWVYDEDFILDDIDIN